MTSSHSVSLFRTLKFFQPVQTGFFSTGFACDSPLPQCKPNMMISPQSIPLWVILSMVRCLVLHTFRTNSTYEKSTRAAGSGGLRGDSERFLDLRPTRERSLQIGETRPPFPIVLTAAP